MSYPSNGKEFSITLEQLLADIEVADDTAQHVAEANGDHRSNLKAILEERGYHKKAFADFRAMAAMSDEKFADYWRTFSACYEAYEGTADARIRDMLDRKADATDGMSDDMAAE